eukprot:gene9931-10786_t
MANTTSLHEDLQKIKSLFIKLRASVKTSQENKREMQELRLRNGLLANEVELSKKDNFQKDEVIRQQSAIIDNLQGTITVLQSSRDREIENIKFELNTHDQINRLKYEIEVYKSNVKNLESDNTKLRLDNEGLKAQIQQATRQLKQQK